MGTYSICLLAIILEEQRNKKRLQVETRCMDLQRQIVLDWSSSAERALYLIFMLPVRLAMKLQEDLPATRDREKQHRRPHPNPSPSTIGRSVAPSDQVVIRFRLGSDLHLWQLKTWKVSKVTGTKPEEYISAIQLKGVCLFVG